MSEMNHEVTRGAAIVTGAAGGIGYASATLLAKNGFASSPKY